MTDITAAVTTNALGEPLVLVERRGHVAIVTLNRPEVRNVINRELTLAVAEALDELEADDAVWVIVITGAGDKAFCAGQDLKAISRPVPPAAGTPVRDLGGWAGITSRRFLKPVIAAVNGYALGGGTEICQAAPLSVRYSKAVAKATVSLAEEEAVRIASELRTAVMGSEDLKEGPRAFAERRAPVWKGR